MGTSSEGLTSLSLSSSRKHTGCKARKPRGKPLPLRALGGQAPRILHDLQHKQSLSVAPTTGTSTPNPDTHTLPITNKG